MRRCCAWDVRVTRERRSVSGRAGAVRKSAWGRFSVQWVGRLALQQLCGCGWQGCAPVRLLGWGFLLWRLSGRRLVLGSGPVVRGTPVPWFLVDNECDADEK